MGKQVIINLAEIVAEDRGITGKVRQSVLDAGLKAHTVKRFLRSDVVVQTQTNTVSKYDLLSGATTFDRTQIANSFGLGKETLTAIRQTCQDADQVYLCAHGSATDRDQVFYDAGIGQIKVLATVSELTDFVTSILDPKHGGPYELILIICFAARSGNPDRVHNKAYLQDPQTLKTSLAYKLFKGLDTKNVAVRMSARLGEVRVSVSQVGASAKWANQILTQTEEGVLAGLRMAEVGHREAALKKLIDEARRNALFYKTAAPANQNERDWLACITECQALEPTKKKEEPDPNNGMLVYEKAGGELTVNFQGEILYRGPML